MESTLTVQASMQVFKGREAEAEGKNSALKFANVQLSREILESIVAEVFKGFGFKAQVNASLPARGGL
jgi:ABC-type proline/glycine betaine transport system substrate-binding protein